VAVLLNLDTTPVQLHTMLFQTAGTSGRGIPSYLLVLVRGVQSDQQAPKAPWQSRSEVVSELTRREYEILQLMTKGATNREIATTIFLSEETVKWHVKHILQKFGVANRGQAVATYLESLKRVECRVAAEGHATRAGWVLPLHVGVSPPNPLTRPRARPTLLMRTPKNPNSLQKRPVRAP
jgi:DNA-binding CsgD family transcriptional regulator